MLQLIDVKKDYYVGSQTINALKGVSLEFEDKGLVAILGQSGCGKTTLMNIIGGLDKYTSGDVVINGQSTKEFKEEDWNAYRNNYIGFVFQTYNLIPHMNVLGNVELALTLSGIDVKERKERAAQMLEKVGLLDQANKKPNQLSGGQCQRVAIARALVNNPSIILADEPTGAIDSETSIQIMDLLKEISKDCLIIMVTHNSELAKTYADRIINMKDGLVLDEKINNEVVEEIIDTEEEITEESIVEETEEVSPTIEEQEVIEEKKEEIASEDKKIKKKKPSMSFLTSLKLSFANLINKKGRTILTVIAGSIGIICISLILAMNSGFSKYISDYEQDSLAKYPVEVFSQTSSLMDMIDNAIHDGDVDMSKIDLTTIFELFKEDEQIREKYTEEEIVYLEKILLSVIERDMDNLGIKYNSDISKFVEELTNYYDPSWGTIRKDYSLRLNIYDTDEDGEYIRINPLYDTLMDTLGSSLPVAIDDETKTEVKAMLDSFKTWKMMVDDKAVLETQYDVLAGHFPDYTTEEGMKEIVVVVDEYNQIDDYMLLFLNKISISDFMMAFLAGSSEDVKQEFDFNEFIGKEYTLMINTDYYNYNSSTKLYDYSSSKTAIDKNGIKIKIGGIVRLKEGLSAGCIDGTIGYTQALAEMIINKINNSNMVKEQIAIYNEYQAKQAKMQAALAQLTEEGYDVSEYASMTTAEQAVALAELMLYNPELAVAIAAGMNAKITSVITGEEIQASEYEQLLEDLSVRNLSKPSSIYIYPTSIENKNKTIEFIQNFNNKVNADPELNSASVDYTVTYTDDLSQITASMQSMINTITYILIAVAVLAVVVAMLLVAIILYISVQDRTKEIGVLRSLGASKGNVSSVFIAETFIIGFISGLIGVIIGLILVFPANAIIVKVLGISNLLQPTWWQCLALIAFSFVTTAISGLIPASLAAKKDPVLALRTE